MRSTVSPMLKDLVSKENLTQSAIKELCEAAGSQQTRREMEAIILSYLYTFLDSSITHLGPGDLAAEDHEVRPDDGQQSAGVCPQISLGKLQKEIETSPR